MSIENENEKGGVVEYLADHIQNHLDATDDEGDWADEEMSDESHKEWEMADLYTDRWLRQALTGVVQRLAKVGIAFEGSATDFDNCGCIGIGWEQAKNRGMRGFAFFNFQGSYDELHDLFLTEDSDGTPMVFHVSAAPLAATKDLQFALARNYLVTKPGCELTPDERKAWSAWRFQHHTDRKEVDAWPTSKQRTVAQALSEKLLEPTEEETAAYEKALYFISTLLHEAFTAEGFEVTSAHGDALRKEHEEEKVHPLLAPCAFRLRTPDFTKGESAAQAQKPAEEA